jgi:NADPH2:quinone reductase
MHAIGIRPPKSNDCETALTDIELPTPKAEGRDLLIEVKAVSVNPVDTKMRKGAEPSLGSQPAPDAWRVLGWDASGVVAGVGPAVTLFRPGEAVFYAGAIGRSGTNAEFHLVDERIVGHKPKALDWAAAAALPLTSITAWEVLFDRLDVKKPVRGAARAILIVGGAGGVGSIAIQLTRTLTDLTVIATASRPETISWVKEMGAHHVIDHYQPLAAQVASLELGAPAFVLSTTQTNRHASEIAQLIAPQGRFGVIDGLTEAELFASKSVSIHWELMFTRSIYETDDMAEQGALLNEVARLVDGGTLRSTETERHAPISAANLMRVHALLESGRARGKIVLEGFGASSGFSQSEI